MSNSNHANGLGDPTNSVCASCSGKGHWVTTCHIKNKCRDINQHTTTTTKRLSHAHGGTKRPLGHEKKGKSPFFFPLPGGGRGVLLATRKFLRTHSFKYRSCFPPQKSPHHHPSLGLFFSPPVPTVPPLLTAPHTTPKPTYMAPTYLPDLYIPYSNHAYPLCTQPSCNVHCFPPPH